MLRATTTPALVAAILRPVRTAMAGVAARMGVALREEGASSVAAAGAEVAYSSESAQDAVEEPAELPANAGPVFRIRHSQSAVPENESSSASTAPRLMASMRRTAAPRVDVAAEVDTTPSAEQPDSSPASAGEGGWGLGEHSASERAMLVQPSPRPSHFHGRGVYSVPSQGASPQVDVDARISLPPPVDLSAPGSPRKPLSLFFETSTTPPAASTRPSEHPAPGPAVVLAERVTRAASPIWEDAHRIAHAALTMDQDAQPKSSAAASSQAVSNTFNVSVHVDPERADAPLDRDELEQALCNILRDAARRHGLEV